jgi:hypothetical protein
MIKMKNIFSWLGEEGEKSIILDAEKHIQETFKTVSYFDEAIKSFIKNDMNAKAANLDKVRESEHLADLLKAKMIDMISESLLIPPDREDLLRFVKTLDKVADWTLGSARLLLFIENKFPDNVLKNMAAASELIISSVSSLRDALVFFIRRDRQKALAKIDDIDRLEHEADERKRLFIESILNARLDPNNLILMFNLAEHMEGVTDKINSAADFIRVLAIKHT